MEFLHKKNNQFSITKRLVYLEAIPVETIANDMGRKLLNTVPDILKSALSGEKLEALKRTLFVKSKDVMVKAGQSLGSKATEAEIRAAMSKAAEPVAKAMFDAEMKAAQQATTVAAEKLAADAAARAAAKAAAEKAVADTAAKTALRTVTTETVGVARTALNAGQVVESTALATTTAESSALATTSGATIETAAVETTAAGAGVTAAAVLAALAAWGWAGYEGYKLYKLTSTVGFETKSEVEQRTLKSQGDMGYSVDKIPAQMTDNLEIYKTKFRSASVLARDTATNIALNVEDYKADDVLSKARLEKAVKYGEELSKQMEVFIAQPGVPASLFEKGECQTALNVLNQAKKLALSAINGTALNKSSDDYKDYKSKLEKARLARDKNTVSTKANSLMERIERLLSDKKQKQRLLQLHRV